MSACGSCTLVDRTATLPAKSYRRYNQVKLSIAFNLFGSIPRSLLRVVITSPLTVRHSRML